MKSVETFKAEIYIGFREQYSNKYHAYEEVIEICKEYVNEVGLCVSIEKIDFVYTDGGEPGAKVTLINYPRFETTPANISLTAGKLGHILMEKFKQFRVSIVTTDKTYMLENTELLNQQETKQ